MDDRARSLLKTLVERYIADGQPVGSRTLSRASGLELSPATIRNVMADLEDLGLIASPHTSAGRIPTARGYRLFVDTMLTARPVDIHHTPPEMAGVHAQLQPDQPQRVAGHLRLQSVVAQVAGHVDGDKNHLKSANKVASHQPAETRIGQGLAQCLQYGLFAPNRANTSKLRLAQGPGQRQDDQGRGAQNHQRVLPPGGAEKLPG